MEYPIAGKIDDKSGAAAGGPALITIVLPILCILILVATGISMVTGTFSIAVPNVITEVLPAIFFVR